MAVIAAMSLAMTSCDGDDYWYDPYGWYDHYDDWGWSNNDWNNGWQVVRRIMDLWKRHRCSQANGMDQ